MEGDIYFGSRVLAAGERAVPAGGGAQHGPALRAGVRAATH